MNRLARVHKRESQSDFDLEPIEATPAGHVKTGHLEGAAGEPGFGGEGDMGKGGGNQKRGTASRIAPEAAFLPPSWQEEEEPPDQQGIGEGVGLSEEYESSDVCGTLKDLGFDDSLSLSLKSSTGKVADKAKVRAVDLLNDFIDF